jgi:hypothetical protein
VITEISRFERKNELDDDESVDGAQLENYRGTGLPPITTPRMSQADPASPFGSHQELLTGRLIPVLSTNPITGLLCNVPLYVFYETFRQVFAQNTRLRKQSSIRSDAGHAAKRAEAFRLTLPDFLEMVRLLVPDAKVSEEYAKRMLIPFSTASIGQYNAALRVPFTAVFSYLAQCFGNATVERNVKFLFKVLDQKHRGYLPSQVLTGRVLRAWAENRVMGGAITYWRILCKAFDDIGEIDPRLLENPGQVTKDELRLVAYCSKTLTEAFLNDLECELTAAPRRHAATGAAADLTAGRFFK